MQSQVKLGLPLTPQKFNTLFVRAHSQPTRIKTTQKIKINLKKLPTDFFTGHPYLQKINNIAKIKSRQYTSIQSHRQSNDQFLSNTINFSTQQDQTEPNKRQLTSFKRERLQAVIRTKNNTIQPSSQNKNSMNWTFSRNFGLQQRKNIELKTRTSKIRTQRSKTIEADTEFKEQQDFCKQKVYKMPEESVQAIKNIISDKISEMNVNRLRINVRKNNHPLQTIQLMKRQLG